MEDRIKKGIEEIKNIRMSENEKGIMLKKIISSPEPIQSPYTKKSFWHIFINQNKLSYSFAALALIIMVGGTTAYSAETSLPGDVLYPLKVKLTEPVRNIVNLTPESKASWEATKAVRRVEEGVILANQNKLDESNLKVLEDNFIKHVEKFDSRSKSIATSSKTKKEDIITKFEEKLSNNAKALKEISEHKDEEEQNESIDEEEKKVEEETKQNAKVLEKTIREKLQNQNREENKGEVRGEKDERKDRDINSKRKDR